MQRAEAGLDHRRRPAEIGGVAGELAVVETFGDVVHEAALAGPGAALGLAGQSRRIAEIRMFRRQRLELGAAVEIGLGPDAVHERDRLRVTLLEKVEDHRPRARHAGAAGEKEKRAAARLAHDEAAVGAAELDAVAELQRFVDIARAGAAGDAPDLQLDCVAVRRRVGDREGARALDTGQPHHHVLPGLEVDPIAFERRAARP